jgi:exopolysaccharide production protein ExoZ
MRVEASERLEGIQVARAIAALTVAYYHSYAALRGFPEAAQMPFESLKMWGFLGVNFFFVISGYIICLVASKDDFAVRSFFIKRIFRLYPMYWIVMAVAGAMVVAGKYDSDSVNHFLYSMTLLPQHEPTFYQPSWTLEREVVFYALAAMIIPLAGVSGLAVLLAALAAGGWYFGNPWSFHLVSTTQADFLAGVLVFLSGGIWKRIGSIVPLIGGAGLLVYTRSHEFAFAPTISLAIILIGMINLKLPWQRWPFRWVVATGNASYSLYLLHPIVFFWAYWTCANLPVQLPGWLCEPWRYATLLAGCLISYAMWQLIERPMIRVGNRIAGRNFRARQLKPVSASTTP